MKNIKLNIYTPDIDEALCVWIAEFFDYHSAMVVSPDKQAVEHKATDEAKRTLEEWLSDKCEVYIIESDGVAVGFARIGYRGDIVAWLEDIYVVPHERGKGIGTYVITLCEEIVKMKDGYKAMCMDVSLRNAAALKLYHRIGYDTLSLVTVRKEFGENPRDNTLELLGEKYKY